MWDFDLGRANAAMVKTAPFIMFRMVIYFGIALAYIIATGTAAGIGYGIASISKDPGVGAFYGGIFGLGAVSAVLYWAREYLLYIVKAGHIAVLVEWLDGKPLPQGRNQIDHAHVVIKERFKEASVLFGIDQLIKGILQTVNRLVFSVSNLLPLPGIQNIAGFINKVLDMSLTYTDEIILAYNIKTASNNTWASSKTALILYAQNYKVMLKNALFLLLFMYAAAFAVFLVILAPVGGLMTLFPGSVGGWSFIMALIFAWSFKASLLEPLAMAALMQVYFKTIEGQQPNPEWERKLAEASAKFRELSARASSYINETLSQKSPTSNTDSGLAPMSSLTPNATQNTTVLVNQNK